MWLLSGEQQCWPTSMYSMVCYRRWKCIRRSSTTATTSSKPSLSCGSNAGMLQRNPPRMQWMHSQHAICLFIIKIVHKVQNASMYPNLSILLQVLVTLLVTTPRQSIPFPLLNGWRHRLPSVVNGRWAAVVIGANDANRTCRSRWQVCFTGPPKLNFLR